MMSLYSYNKMFDEKSEKINEEDLKKIQLSRLKDLVHHCYTNSKLYQKKFNEFNVRPTDIKKLEDLKKLPFTTKEDLRLSWPFGAFAVSLEQIKKIHTTSGTTGKPTVIGFTDADWNSVVEMAARAMKASTIGKGDIVHNTTPYGLFFAGASTQAGAERAGATVVPVGPGNPEQHMFLIEHFKPTVIMGVPSFILSLADYAKSKGMDPKKTSLKKAFLLGEPITKATIKRLENTWNVECFSGYGITEIGASGTCINKDGYHWPADHVIVEIINPETGEVLEEGKEGEAVYTTITRKGVPLIRFRSGDLTKIMDDCSCGRTLPKLNLIAGRIDNRTKIKGTLILPKDFEEAILSIPEVYNYLTIVEKNGEMDYLKIYLESDTDVSEQIKNNIKAITNITPNEVIVLKKGEIPKGERKLKRFIDSRKQNESDLQILEQLKNVTRNL